MDRLNQIRGEAGSSRDSTLDTSSPPSEAYISANESSSKYFSLSEVDSTFGISPSKDSVSTADADRTITTETNLMTEISPIPKSDLESYKIGKQIEAAKILSGRVNIFDDNDNSYDGDELIIDDNSVEEEKSPTDLKLDDSTVPPEDKNEQSTIESLEDDIIPSKDTEVVLQIDGNNVHAIDIGNGLYLYRKAGEEELAAVQIIDDDQQQPSFKFLKVRENTEGNLEVYEEIEVEVTKEVPIKEGEIPAEKSSHVPIKDISKVINEPLCNKVADKAIKTPKNELSIKNDEAIESNVDASECKTEVNFNGKMMKFNESRKSPVIGTFTPMTYHSTPNKEGIPLTKTMVDQQLHPSRHSDNVKKTIEVHTDSPKQKLLETPTKTKKTFNEIDIASKYENKKETDSLVKNLNEQFDCTTDTLLDKNSPVESISNEKLPENNLPLPNNLVEESKDTKTDEVEIKTTDKESEDATIKNNDDTEISEVIPKEDEMSKNNEELKRYENEENNKVVLLNPEINVDVINEELCNTANNKQLKQTELDEDSNESEVKLIENDSEESNLIIDDKESILTSEQDNTAKEDSDGIHIITERDLINTDTNSKDSEAQKLRKSSEASLGMMSMEKTSSENTDDLHNNLLVESIENNDNVNSNVTIRESNNLDVVDKDSLEIIDISEDSNELAILSKCGESDVENNEFKDELIAENNSNLNSNNITDTAKSSQCDNNVKDCIKENLNEQKIEITSKLINKENKCETIVVDKVSINMSEDVVCDKDYTSIYESDGKNKDIVIIKDIQENNSTKLKSLESDVIPVQEKPISLEIIASENDVQSKSNNIVCVQKDLSKTFHGLGSHKSSKIETNLKEKHIFTNKQDTLKCADSNTKNDAHKDEIKIKPTISKVINNNSAVPFGKWTEANRQEFLNKIKETKIPSNNSNTKQLKQPNDLNRRDVLKKIDSQRQSNVTSLKGSDSGLLPKINTKTETLLFVSKSSIVQPSSAIDTTVTTLNVQDLSVPPKPAVCIVTKQNEPTNSNSSINKNIQRKELNNQDLIDITIEGIINRAITGKGIENINEKPTDIEIQNTKHCPVSLDDIEMKMNDIHGISCHKEPTQDLCHTSKPLAKPEKVKTNISEKVPKLLPFKKKVHKKVMKNNVLEDTSEDEIIEHEPITGDIDGNKQNLSMSTKNKSPESKRETIITENDFDKFARRNSITYENCLTVSFDGKESHNVIQTIVEKEPPVKKLSRNEIMLAESKAKSSNKHNMPVRSNTQLSRIPTLVKGTNEEDNFNKNNQSKVQIAYQSALTAKRNLECPITIIEDKPVKVVFMDANTEFTPSQLNVQGKELSPSKTEIDFLAHSASESLDSDVLESSKIQDETKVKSKHQRKQVLTPVEEPEIELIEPGDLGIHFSPKKKRRCEDKNEKRRCEDKIEKRRCEDKIEKHSKNIVPKKSYLLNRNVNDEKTSNKSNDSINYVTNIKKDSEKRSDSFIGHTDAISAIDNLVKAAELIETQSENKSSEIGLPTSETTQSTPVKRGRGRPRKYPLVEPETDKNKVLSPQKKLRLIDAKVTKTDTTDSDGSSDEGIIQENWTMGKINENIVCPICSKLFRSENVVFKHVKHCPGPSPNRSDSDKRSPVRLRYSQDSDKISRRSDDTDNEEEEKPRSRRSRYTASKLISDNEVIVIEDTPLKEKPEKVVKEVNSDSKATNIKTKPQQSKTHNLICEFCGKTFRQLSYLVNHKIQQHKKENTKSQENDHQPLIKTVFSCEVCKKDFRKLHHLVQHRLIHNSSTNNIRITRKSSSDQHDIKPLKPRDDTKSSTDPSAGFRCEPCDKSFRKLHHLVEHRETHDGINKKSSTTSTSSTQNAAEAVDVQPTHNCDICKKVFKKLQDLLEHKELHFETSSEKSDDKSVKSSLSTKDIIHECSLCYMVFPNEHSLNKHTILCLRKKKQSAAKAARQAMEKQAMALDSENVKEIENFASEEESPNSEQLFEDDDTIELITEEDSLNADEQNQTKETIQPLLDTKIEDDLNTKKHPLNPDLTEVSIKSEKKEVVDKQDDTMKKDIENLEKPAKIKKKEIPECIIIPDTPTPKKKVLVKDKLSSTITKKIKTVTYPTSPVVKEPKLKESSDEDDDIRYMLNPNFKKEETSESKIFMKVRAKKRNSLQIERPNSKDLVKRRISLQHPPKIPRLKAKAIETKPNIESKTERTVKLDVKEIILSTDSDDSDVKYSFPDPVSTEASKGKKLKRQSVAGKRKSISGIAKQKILGKHKLATPKTRKRTSEAEHRCDCGQLFSSAALLSRHTSLAHTPPRIRRRRSPPPEQTHKPLPKDKPKLVKRKSDVTNSNTANPGVGTRKSSVSNSDAKGSSDSIKKCEFSGKSLRSSTIRGVPVPEKIRKLMEKTKK